MSPTPKDKARPAAPAAATPAAKPKGRMNRPRRTGLIGFGVILVLLFALIGVESGLSNPTVSSDDLAVVEDAVPDTGTITLDDLDRSIEQAAARGGQPVPKEGTKAYDELQDAAINELLDTVWIQGQADEMGIEVTDSDISDELATIKKSQFRSEAEFEAFLKQSKFTDADVQLRVKLQLLSDAIQKQAGEDAPAVTDEQISDYYEAAKSQFAVPASRDVRLVLNSDKAKVDAAKADLEEGSTDADWKTIAAKYSTDPASKDTGGLRPGLTEGLVEEPLNKEIFGADEGEIVGPVKTPLGYYVFQVDKITEADTQPLKDVKKQISDQLTQQNQQTYFESFVEDYGQKWQSRTFCNDDYIVERCENYKAPAHPETVQGVAVDQGCYEAHPDTKPKACPAAVALLNPALPGTVSLLNPTGTALPQRPRPAGLKPVPAATGLPGAASGGLPPGTTGAPPGSTPGG